MPRLRTRSTSSYGLGQAQRARRDTYGALRTGVRMMLAQSDDVFLRGPEDGRKTRLCDTNCDDCGLALGRGCPSE